MPSGQMPSGEMEARDQASEEQGTTEVQMREMPYVPDGPESLGKTGASGLSSGMWSLWELRQGSTAIYAPAATAWGENRIDLFAIGLNSQIYQQWWDGKQWSEWEFLEGTYSISAPAAVSVGKNRLEVFWIGIDKQVYRRSWNGSQWSQRESLGGVAIHGVAATSWGPDRIDLFTVGTDSSLYHKYWDGSTWSAWKIMKFKGHEADEKSSTCISAPAAVSWGLNRIDVFALGIDNYVYHAWGDGSSEWRGWEKLGGPCIHGVAIASRGVNSLDLFSISTDTIGTDNHMYHRSWNGSSWSRWENLGGACISAPAAVSWGENRLDVLVIGTRSAIWQKSWVREGGGLGASELEDEKPQINLVLKDDNDQVYANKKYEILINGKKYGDQERRTSKEGIINEEIPSVKELELKIWFDDEQGEPEIYKVEVGGLDPIDTVAGVQDRLNNLGYSCGEEQGKVGSQTQEALKAFQTDNDLIATGGIDELTRKKILEKHDGITD